MVRLGCSTRPLTLEFSVPFYAKGAVRIHYEEVGSGIPLLLIPGVG
jgi:hypothetical protein